MLYSDDSDDITVVQPNEDGSYWRKIVRNKMHRMKEARRAKVTRVTYVTHVTCNACIA